MRNILIVLLLSTVLISCTDSNKSKSASTMIYTSGGRTSEVLVVISNSLWDSPLGDSIRMSLENVPEYLPRNQPEFDITHIPHKAFGNMYQKQRNIIFIKKDDLKKGIIKIQKNKFARPQTYVSIKAKTAKELIELFIKHKDRINELFHENEVTRITNTYGSIEVKTLTKELNEKFGFSMVLPKGFYVATDKADFMWLRRPATDVEEGIIISTRPYVDTTDFSLESMIRNRDKLTRKYIPGPVDNSYMKVSNIFPATQYTKTFKGHYASQLRSMWDVKGYAMGGPFVSYTFVDKKVNRLITIDGYIKAPKKEKRDLLLHIEAIFNSFAYTDADTK